jgi:glutathione synthase/RimK-type ligase-like ATP-grasp enzyme
MEGGVLMKLRIQPYKTWSGGAKALGLRAGILRATRKQVQKHGDFSHILNWGSSERRFNGEYINNPENVRVASDKKATAEVLEAAGISTPETTTDKAVAQSWLDNGNTVVARKLLRASQGRGIVIVCPEDHEISHVHTLPAAPLYVKYVKKGREFRVHVFDGHVIDVQEKKRKLEVPDEQVNWQVRNHANGWIFARTDVQCPASVVRSSVDAVAALGLDFGAVDVGYNMHKETAYVFEVNTAPGLQGDTLDAYYRAALRRFPQLIGGMYLKRRNM